MKRISSLVCYMLSVCMFFLAGCTTDWQMDVRDAGINISGEWRSSDEYFPENSKAIIRNTNLFSVSVRHVVIEWHRGEYTISFFVLPPGGEREVSIRFTDYVKTGFHLYAEQSVQIGFIRAVPIKIKKEK